MIIWIIENGELVKYERTGECLQCGACCNTDGHAFRYNISIAGKEAQANANENSDIGWVDFENYSVFESQGLWWYILSGNKEKEMEACESFVDGKCAVHDDRDEHPAICHYWPVNPKDLHSGCGYKFERVEE